MANLDEKDKSTMDKIAETMHALPESAQVIALAFAEGVAAATELSKSE